MGHEITIKKRFFIDTQAFQIYATITPSEPQTHSEPYAAETIDIKAILYLAGTLRGVPIWVTLKDAGMDEDSVLEALGGEAAVIEAIWEELTEKGEA